MARPRCEMDLITLCMFLFLSWWMIGLWCWYNREPQVVTVVVRPQVNKDVANAIIGELKPAVRDVNEGIAASVSDIIVERLSNEGYLVKGKNK